MSAYSPSEAAKVYEKPIIRQSIPVFRPDLTLQELRPEVIAQRNTIEGHINLCEQIAYVSFDHLRKAIIFPYLVPNNVLLP